MYTHTHKLLCMRKSHPAHSKHPALCKQITEGKWRMEVRAWLKLQTDYSVYIIFLHVQSLLPTVALWTREDTRVHQPTSETHRQSAEEPKTCDRITKDKGHAEELISNDTWVLMTSDTGNRVDLWHTALSFNSAQRLTVTRTKKENVS